MEFALRAAAERRFARRFYALVLGVWAAAVVLFAGTAVNFTLWISVLQFVLIALFFLSFAFGFSKRLVSLVVKPYRLAKLEARPRRPRVAVLYTTMNDAVPECLEAIHQTYPVDVFLLDDSKDPYKRELVDRIAGRKGFRVIRRTDRRGFKAGALNHWLSLHGAEYDYFVILDADSLLPPDWVEEALTYAEHPENADLAIFQGLINLWNTDKPFPRALAPNQRLGQDEWELKVAGYLGAVVCYGHNVMLRTKHVLAVGGFDEGYVSEDFATAVRLASAGYGSTFVPLHTWEALPENVRGFVKRQTKWTRGSMEFWSFVPRARLPWYKRLTLLSIPWGHLAYATLMAAMFAAVFGRASSLSAFFAFGANLITAPVAYIWSIPLFRFLILMSAVTGVFTVVKLLQIRLGWLAYYRARTLSKAIGSIMLPHELRAMAAYLVNRRRTFPVTPKDEPPMTLREIVHTGRGTVALMGAFALGLVLWNPVGLWYNVLWFLSFSVSPVVLWWYCGPRTASPGLPSGGQRDFARDPRLRTARHVDRPRW